MSSRCSLCYAVCQHDELCSPIPGHGFHLACFFKWLERSKAGLRRQTIDCQQTSNEDAAVLHEKLDNMKLEDKDVDHYKNESQVIKKQSEELRIKVEKLEAEINLKKSQMTSNEENLADLNKKLISSELKISLNKKDVDHYKNEYEKSKEQIAELKEIIHTLEAKINLKNDNIAALEEENEKLKDIGVENDTLKSDVLHLKKQLNDVKKELTLANSLREEDRDKIKQLESQLNKDKAEKVHVESSSEQENLDDLNESNNNKTSKRLKAYSLRSKHH